jgi:hypothetical protein
VVGRGGSIGALALSLSAENNKTSEIERETAAVDRYKHTQHRKCRVIDTEERAEICHDFEMKSRKKLSKCGAALIVRRSFLVLCLII